MAAFGLIAAIMSLMEPDSASALRVPVLGGSRSLINRAEKMELYFYGGFSGFKPS
jgi:hypothetical protein